MRIVVTSSLMAPQTIKLLLQNFTVFVVYFGVYLDPCGLRTYFLLENSSILHSSLNMTSFQKQGSNMAYALRHFKRLLACRSFNKDFFAAIRPINPYFRGMRFTVLTEKVWLDFHYINNSHAVFYGFLFEARMSNRSDLVCYPVYDHF